MAGVARKSDPELWDRVKSEVTAGDKGGKPGQWSARKAQLATAEYQRRGGGYLGRKSGNRGKTPGKQVQHCRAERPETAVSRHFLTGGRVKLNSIRENHPGFCPAYGVNP